MKILFTILILLIVLIAGCTQQPAYKEPEAKLKAELDSCSFYPKTLSTEYNYAFGFTFKVTNIGDKPTKLPSSISLEPQPALKSGVTSIEQGLEKILAKGDSVNVTLVWTVNIKSDLDRYNIYYVENESGAKSLIYIGNTNPCKDEVALQEVKNVGCNSYLHQNITINGPAPCANWAMVLVTWKGLQITFENFTKEAYNCIDENCARQLCACPGY
jgi:hypothetical protein